MAANSLAYRYGVREKGAQRRRVQPTHVIDFEEGVDDQFPVADASNRVLAVKAMVSQADRIEGSSSPR